MNKIRAQICSAYCHKTSFLVALGILFPLAIIVSVIKHQGYGVTYQVSESMPKGWYLIIPVKQLTHSTIVVFTPPRKARHFLLAHHWLPDTQWMMKPLAAIPGDTVCNRHGFLLINHQKIARVYSTDSLGDRLPYQPICTELKRDEYLPVSTHVKNSYDGRYFGPISHKTMQGIAIKL